MKRTRALRWLAALAAAALNACAALSPAPAPAAAALAELPPQWHAPLPHDGRLEDLQRWWQQFNDPLLSALMSAAQDVSPTLASARARLEQSRAARIAAGAALVPKLDANAAALRGQPELATPLATSASATLQAAWEIDVFGAHRAARDAAQARQEGAAAAWHDARVAVAAEVATSYTQLRACEAQLAQTQLDAASRAETARLTDLSAQAGFQAPASAALARASAAQGNATLTQQRAACDLLVKALVALTGSVEPELRHRLTSGVAQVPQPAGLALARVPAAALAQRPDLHSAARNVVAASADISQTQAQRLPRVSLSGSIGAARLSTGTGTIDGNVWSLGPLSVSLPLFDGGARRANVDAARARYDEAVALYRGKLRAAVREVEEALVALQSTAARGDDARIAAEGFEASYRATEARYKGGLASLFELEDARRSAVAAQIALIELQRERTAAWIALYRALGGGWSASDAPEVGGAHERKTQLGG